MLNENIMVIMAECGIDDFHVLKNNNDICTIFIDENAIKDNIVEMLNEKKELYGFSDIELTNTNVKNIYNIAIEFCKNSADEKRATNFKIYKAIANIILK